MKLLPLLAALPLLFASVVSANTLMSVGYFNGGGDVTAGPGGNIDKLDVRQITHLNYSFGLIYNDEKGETNAALKDPGRLHQIWLSPKVQADLQKIPHLRQQNPNLKVLLSVGGWGARGFSGAAATKETRALFIQSAQEIIEKYGLDGIDLDWEYPVNGAWGLVDSQPADRDNFTALLKELRAAVGNKKLVTIAVGANAESPKSWVDVKAAGAGEPSTGSDDFAHRGQVAPHLQVDVAHAGADLFFGSRVAFAGVAHAEPGENGVEILFFFTGRQIIRLSDKMAQIAVKSLLTLRLVGKHHVHQLLSTFTDHDS